MSITEEFLQTLSLPNLLEQKARFLRRSNELQNMNHYLSSENRDLFDRNEGLKKTAERLIKISNGVVFPKDEGDGSFGSKFHKIFGPIREKLKKPKKVVFDLSNDRELGKAFNSIKENFNEMIAKKGLGGNQHEKKKIFDNSNLSRKSFEFSNEAGASNNHQDSDKKPSGEIVEEIKFEAKPKEEEKDNSVNEI